MKIEKINENQIRCTLTKQDLADRQIKISELAYGSEKAKSLFQDMIEKANDEFGFEAEDIPLMIEAIPLSGENIILQITKVEYPEEMDPRFSRFSEAEEEENSMDQELFSETKGADDVLDVCRRPEEDKEFPKDQLSALTRMFEFADLSRVERLSHVLGDYYMGRNDLYKDAKRGTYCLVLRKSAHSPEEFNKVCNIISEYARQRRYTPATEAYFQEHGKAILKENALEILRSIEG